MEPGTETVSPHLKTVALAATTLAGFLTPFMGSAINVALPAIAEEFSLNAVTLNWVATAYILSAAMFLVPFGRLADIHGRKRIFMAGLVVYTTASVLSALAFSAASLIFFRALQGFGGAMIFGTSVAILTSIFPQGERGKALGINTAAVYLGLSLGPVIGGFLTQNFGWRSLFLVNGPVGLLALLLAATRMPQEWAEARGEKFDLAGSLLFGAGLIALMYGLSQLPGPDGFVLVFAGLIIIAVFFLLERAAAAPVLDIRLFAGNKIFAFSNLAALIHYSATAAVAFLLSLYLQYMKGFSPQKTGLILIIQPAIMATVSPLSGKFSDRIEPRWLASAGMALSSAGLILFVFLGGNASSAFLIAGLSSLGLGFGLFSSPNTNAVMGSIERRFCGVAAAILGTMRLMGQMLSLGILMMIFALLMGRGRIQPENYPLFLRSLKTAFALFAALCAIGVAASLARGNNRSLQRSVSRLKNPAE